MLQDNDIRMCETVHLSPALVATPIYSEMLAVIVRAKDGNNLISLVVVLLEGTDFKARGEAGARKQRDKKRFDRFLKGPPAAKMAAATNRWAAGQSEKPPTQLAPAANADKAGAAAAAASARWAAGQTARFATGAASVLTAAARWVSQPVRA